MSQQVSFLASWGKLLNISSGHIVVQDDTFSLVPNDLMTSLSWGTDYRVKTYPIEAIAGYKQIFLAWMAILLNDGQVVKVSLAPKSKKLKLIAALEERRAAIFAAKGQAMPAPTSTI